MITKDWRMDDYAPQVAAALIRQGQHDRSEACRQLLQDRVTFAGYLAETSNNALDVARKLVSKAKGEA